MSSPNPIKIDPEIMHGTPCFAGTRVPVKSLFDYLKHGRTLDYFLQQFPTVEREQVLQVLDMAGAGGPLWSRSAADRQTA